MYINQNMLNNQKRHGILNEIEFYLKHNVVKKLNLLNAFRSLDVKSSDDYVEDIMIDKVSI